VVDSEVDAYVRRSTRWPEEMRELRGILVGRGLSEQLKWGKPCYTHDGRNVVVVQEMKDFLALMFFKGALLSDPDGVLEEQGPNSRSARRIRFTSVDEVHRLADIVGRYLDEAIEVEASGAQLEPPPELVLVEELQERLDGDPELREAFEALTPGRQREYHLFVAGAKQSTTRSARVDKHVQRIKEGKGLRDR
jgi:uncharacterized protein YdeI (YjbR/CyaY-like superfamily)